MPTEQFFNEPILNSPYEYPSRHWELDKTGQPTGNIVETRREAKLISPIPKPQKVKGKKAQQELELDAGEAEEGEKQKYDPIPIIDTVRRAVDEWRKLPPSDWQVTPETARLLLHWRDPSFQGMRPFFCQVEAAETLIWLTEVAPRMPKGSAGARVLKHLEDANGEANPELYRIALKLATGAGKTTVMAMVIAWQTINAVRRPGSRNFTKGFLIVAPGITIKDRLRVLQPNDSQSYFQPHRGLVPVDMLNDLLQARIVITNYHSFKLRERLEISTTGKALLKGRGEDIQTLETEGQMIQRVMPGLMGMRNILVINDEAHHCYREKPGDAEDSVEDKAEAKDNNEAARVWITGIETVKRKLGIMAVCDLSATPFFLNGSGYREGTLFHWTVSDFSLMDAIECGIVKLPRLPIADNVPGEEMPRLRNLWAHVGKDMPQKSSKASGKLDPLSLPLQLKTALEALYGHYKLTFDLWQQEGIRVPPVFIVVCNNTASSRLVYDYISGFNAVTKDGKETFHGGALPLFSNYESDGRRKERPVTLLIDSHELESGEPLSKEFKDAASAEIERFRQEIVLRTGNRQEGENITDSMLLREVMNTVGREGKLGEQIRCVVSVSMLTEGWDANTVTHILGVRAFGTQLLCEQVVGRALRRQSYDLNEKGLFNVEYADILGVPFDFTAKPIAAKATPPAETVMVQAIPERKHLEIRFPQVVGYRVELPADVITAKFSGDSVLELTPDLIGPTITRNSGIIGGRVDLTLKQVAEDRMNSIVYGLTKHMIYEKLREPNEEPKIHLFGQVRKVVEEWINGGNLKCRSGTYPALLFHRELADLACEKIKAAIINGQPGDKTKHAILDAYNPVGSTARVSLPTTSKKRWQTDARKCHINWAIWDSEWEVQLCRAAEAHDKVIAYVKNHGLGFEIPYVYQGRERRYRPDFILKIDDGHVDPLNLIVEIKGKRQEDAKIKADTVRSQWLPAVNRLRKYGRWDFIEITDVHLIDEELNNRIQQLLNDGAKQSA
ncbi:MAG: BPTD_3080 family restriction endonuclease [Spirochaetota bacterium]